MSKFDSRPVNLYICAAGHSGSTLLDLLLGSHSHVTSLGEITQLPKNLSLNTVCTCGKPVRECRFWAEVLERLGRRMGRDLRINPYALDLGYIDARVVIDRDHQTALYNVKRRLANGVLYLHWRHGFPAGLWGRSFRRAIRNNLELYDVVREISGRPVVVDSTKHYLKAIGLYEAEPEATRVILLSRDGRGVFHSNRRRRLPRKTSLAAWSSHYRRDLPLLERLPDTSLIRVRYEDLCSNAENELRRISEFVGLEYEDGMRDFASNVHHIANGNDMRYQTSSEIRYDERWRQEMSEQDLEYFEKHAWKLNKVLGYGD